jgi:hypothetical protein
MCQKKKKGKTNYFFFMAVIRQAGPIEKLTMSAIYLVAIASQLEKKKWLDQIFFLFTCLNIHNQKPFLFFETPPGAGSRRLPPQLEER